MIARNADDENAHQIHGKSSEHGLSGISSTSLAGQADQNAMAGQSLPMLDWGLDIEVHEDNLSGADVKSNDPYRLGEILEGSLRRTGPG